MKRGEGEVREKQGTGEEGEVLDLLFLRFLTLPHPSHHLPLTAHVLSCYPSYAITSLESILMIKEDKQEVKKKKKRKRGGRGVTW